MPVTETLDCQSSVFCLSDNKTLFHLSKSHVWGRTCKVHMDSFVVLKETEFLKMLLVPKALSSQMLSDGFWAAISTSYGLNLVKDHPRL